MNEASEGNRLKEQIAGAARRLVDRLRNGFGGDETQLPPNPADVAAAEAALGMDTPEAAATLTELFPQKFPTQAVAERAVTGVGAGINQARRDAAATDGKNGRDH